MRDFKPDPGSPFIPAAELETNDRSYKGNRDDTAETGRPGPAKEAGIPLLAALCPAGFPSPAEDYIERQLDLHEYAVKNPGATFFMRAAGDSMLGAGIHNGDILVVDRSADARPGCIVIASLDGEYTVKMLERRGERLFLTPANPHYQETEISGRDDVDFFGVVTFVLHKCPV